MWQIIRRERRVELAGELRFAAATSIWRTLRSVIEPPEPTLDFDLSRVVAIDGAIMSLVVELRSSLVARGIPSEIVGASDQIAPIVRLYSSNTAVARPEGPARPGAVERLGLATEQLALRMRRVLGQLGKLLSSPARARTAGRADWKWAARSLPVLVIRAGSEGMPIVLLLNFLIGFVAALQTTTLLKLYGANIYVADLVGVSVTRELAPLITAVIVTGRSGAAYAAELGTMRVSEEIDALRMMGFSPRQYLVVPRVIALAIVTPALTLLGDVVGVFGGLVVGVSRLGVTPHAFVSELRTILVPGDVWSGLNKGVAYGIAIALIGCWKGLSARGAASGVGRSTTSAVVYCLFAIVLIDTAFTLVFGGVGE